MCVCVCVQALSSELGAADSGKVVAFKCDVTKEQEVVALFEKARELGGADVLVSNAGLAHNEPLLSGETSQWREMMEVLSPLCSADMYYSAISNIVLYGEQVNVIGLCVCNREFLRQAEMRGMDDGHIILLNRSENVPNWFLATSRTGLTAFYPQYGWSPSNSHSLGTLLHCHQVCCHSNYRGSQAGAQGDQVWDQSHSKYTAAMLDPPDCYILDLLYTGHISRYSAN